MSWFSSKKKSWTDGSDKVTNEVIGDLFARAGIKRISFRDNIYQRLSEDRLKDFIWKHHDPSQLESRDEVLDCDDFSILSQADIIKASRAEGFEKPIPWGLATVINKQSGRRHMVNVTVTAENKILYYDPQLKGRNPWKRAEDYEAVEKADL